MFGAIIAKSNILFRSALWLLRFWETTGVWRSSSAEVNHARTPKQMLRELSKDHVVLRVLLPLDERPAEIEVEDFSEVAGGYAASLKTHPFVRTRECAPKRSGYAPYFSE